MAITFHEYGRLVMWPYGYTKTNVPADMTRQDRDALAAIGRHMAATNGYRPEQASDLYVTSGTTRDYEYGRYRIFSYTFELSNVDYPKAWRIAGETGRNKEAVLYLAERAWCPLSVLGPTVRDARCGAFDDDLEVARGWTVDPDGTDTAPSTGRWVRGNPSGTSSGGTVLQRDVVPSGRLALVTGSPAGTSASAYDLDGRTTARSAPIRLPAAPGQRLTFSWLFAHPAASASAADHLRAIIEAEDGTQTVVWERAGSPAAYAGAWRSASVLMDPWAGPGRAHPVRGRGRRSAVDRRGRRRRRAGDPPRRVTPSRGRDSSVVARWGDQAPVLRLHDHDLAAGERAPVVGRRRPRHARRWTRPPESRELGQGDLFRHAVCRSAS